MGLHTRVKLLILQKGMSKRDKNTSRVDMVAKKISWRIEWNFVFSGCIYINNHVPTDTVLLEVLLSHFNTEKNKIIQKKISDIADVTKDEIRVLLRKERCQSNRPQYYHINMLSTLGKQIQDKSIV